MKIVKDKKKIRELCNKVTNALKIYSEINTILKEIAVLLFEMIMTAEDNEFEMFVCDSTRIDTLERDLEKLKEKFKKFFNKTEKVIEFLKTN